MGRDIEELERTARDVEVRTGARVTCGLFEAERWQTHARALEAASGELNGIDVAILAAGELGDQELAARDFDTALSVINTNYVAAVSVLTWLGGYMEERRSGSIVCLTSVAGDRGRPSNFVYGSAKGALALYLQGLRGRLWRSNVHVMTAKLGFVDTKMTYGRKGMFLVASPEAAAASIVRGLRARRDIIYVPGFWRPLMSIIEAVPEPLFKRLPL
jgi:short-subunit dehydrogenase